MMYNSFTILLSASVPSAKRSEKYLKIKNAQIQIEEAVIGLARNTFQAGGKLIFGGHPSISPLVAMVATEFDLNRNVEERKEDEGQKPITIFQSRAYAEVIPQETSGLFKLGYSDIVWTDAMNGEYYLPGREDSRQCAESLYEMRRVMMERPLDALVCIGGMEGVEDEFRMFRGRHPDKLIFLLESTGGATRILAQDFSSVESVKIIDRRDENKPFHGERNELALEEYTPDKIEIIPYGYITALIVQEIQRRR
jgi:hypothetical protein